VAAVAAAVGDADADANARSDELLKSFQEPSS